MARTPGADARLMTRLSDADPAPLQAAGSLDERAEADLAAILATRTVVALPPRRRPLVLVAAAAVVLGVGAVVTGVVQHDDDGVRSGPPFAAAGSPGGPALDAPAGAASSAPVTPRAPDVQTLLALGGLVAYDYQPAESSSDLAADVDLVATGDLVDAVTDEPRSPCGTGVQGPRGELVRLDDVRVAKGTAAGTSIVVAVPLQGVDALPRGTRVLVFASSGTAADCSTAYVTAPQGFVVQAAGGQVVWPLIGEVRDGDLSQALPGGTLIAP